jgi:hypothetical protein
VQWWGLVSIYSKLCAPASLREALFVPSFVLGLRVRFSRGDAEAQRDFWGCEKLLGGAGGSARAVQWWGLVSIYSKLCAPASLREALFVPSFVLGLCVRFSCGDAETRRRRGISGVVRNYLKVQVGVLALCSGGDW